MKNLEKIALSILVITVLFSYNSWARRTKTPEAKHHYQIITEQERATILPNIKPGLTLVKDEEGKIFIVYENNELFPGKSDTIYSYEQYITTEYLVYLLGRELFNLAEVRIITIDEVENTTLLGWMEERGLSRIGISRAVQTYDSNELVNKHQSAEELITFWVWLRDKSHTINHNLFIMPTVEGASFISYDHHRAGTEPEPIITWLTHKSIIVGWLRVLKHTQSYNYDDIIVAARKIESYFNNERLRSIVVESEAGEEILAMLIKNRDTIVSDAAHLVIQMIEFNRSSSLIPWKLE